MLIPDNGDAVNAGRTVNRPVKQKKLSRCESFFRSIVNVQMLLPAVVPWIAFTPVTEVPL
ncbi:MAG: hypothetical protein WCF90_02005 [Methanomicrobiales archaeon]